MTATITEQEVDTDWITVLDFDHAIPCDGEDDHTAVWKIVTSCCGKNIFMCQEHMDRLLEAFTDPYIFFMDCEFCLNITAPPSKVIALAERI